MLEEESTRKSGSDQSQKILLQKNLRSWITFTFPKHAQDKTVLSLGRFL